MGDYQVVWRGPVLDATGYGTASREYALALDRQGADVKIEPYTWNFPYKFSDQKKRERLAHLIEKPYADHKSKILIYHSPPSNITLGEEKKDFDHMILNTVWETNKIPSQWIPMIHLFDAVCVPSTANIKAIQNSGVPVPAHLIPHGADTEAFHPNIPKLSIKEAEDRFVFISVFDFQHRKNPEALLKAYWEEFSQKERVLLIIKTYGDSRKKILSAISEYKRKNDFKENTAPVYIMSGIFSEVELKGLYTLGDVFVLPSRGEGVGLPYLESLSSGTPAIAVSWGGHMDFLNKENSFLVDYKLSHPGKGKENAISKLYSDLFEGEGQLWAEADIGDLKKKMRMAFENPHLCQKKGAKGRIDMLSRSWDHAGVLLKAAIEKTLAKN